MEKYLRELLESGLLECDEEACYVITWRGKEFLQLYEEYVAECHRLHEEIRGVRKDKLLLENMCFNDSKNPKCLLAEREV